MPSCEPCGTYYTPSSLAPDGTCPTCGAPVTTGEHLAAGPGQDVAAVERTVPWHFWVGVAAVIVYLGWRLIQGFLLLF